MKMKMAGKDHMDKAAAMLGYGPDALMTGGARKRVGKMAEGLARKGSMFMGPGEGVDAVRERVSAAIKEEEKKESGKGKGKGKGNENQLLSYGPYPYVKEFDVVGKKVVYECEGKVYGREWSEDGGKVALGPKKEVKEVKMYEAVGG